MQELTKIEIQTFKESEYLTITRYYVTDKKEVWLEAKTKETQA